jgi:hypothetical protein
MADREHERYQMPRSPDYDDHLMEELLSDTSRRATRCSATYRASSPTA